MKTPWINFAFWLFYVHGEAVKLRFFIGQNFIESSEACCTLNWGLLPRHFRNSLRLWRSLLALPCTCEEFDQFDVIFHKPAPNFIWIDSSLMKHSFFFNSTAEPNQDCSAFTFRFELRAFNYAFRREMKAPDCDFEARQNRSKSSAS